MCKTVLHAGGVTQDSTVPRQTAQSMRFTYAGKALGYSKLLDSLLGFATDMFVGFSSVASLIGAQGQANYAAANSSLDGKSTAWKNCGLPTTAIQWGAWAAVGMAAGNRKAQENLKAIGFAMIDPANGLKAMNSVTGGSTMPSAVYLASPIDWHVIRQQQGSPRMSSLLKSYLACIPANAEVFPPSSTVAIAPLQHTKLIASQYVSGANMAPLKLEDIQSDLANAVALVIGSKVDPAQPFTEAGVDSLAAVDLRNEVADHFGIRLPATVLFDHPTLESLAMHISSLKHVGLGASTSLADITSEVMDAITETVGIAVDPHQPLVEAGVDSLAAVELRNIISERVGTDIPATALFDYPTAERLASFMLEKLTTTSMSEEPIYDTSIRMTSTVEIDTTPTKQKCSYGIVLTCRLTSPATADDAAARPISINRWDIELGQQGSTRMQRFGAFLKDVENFDAQAFGLSNTEAAVIDPQHRLILEAAAEVVMLSNRHFSRSEGAASCWPVYIGIQGMEYGQLSTPYTVGTSPYTATSGNLSVAAGRIAYTFGLSGAAVAVDTACSAALVAMHLASRELLLPHDNALAGSVNLTLSPNGYAATMAAGMLSPDGRCKTLDATADGYGRGEACSMARMSRDHGQLFGYGSSGTTGLCIGLLRGSNVNQDGRSSSLTAPNGPSQQEVVTGAVFAAGLTIAQLQSIELHGTGTPLGDPIEVGALTGVLCRSSGDHTVHVVAAKSQRGHAEAAAASVGMSHVLSQLMSGSLQPFIGLAHMNPHVAISLKTTSIPILLPRQRCGTGTDCDLNACGLSSFAYMGTNAHALFSKAAASHDEELSKLCVWDYRRHSYGLILPHGILRQAESGVSRSMLTFQGRLDSPSNSYLAQHLVLGRPIVPGAVMYECLLSSFGILNAEGIGSTSWQQQVARIAVQDISIQAAALLPTKANYSTALSVLQVNIDELGESYVCMQTSTASGGGNSGRVTRHASGRPFRKMNLVTPLPETHTDVTPLLIFPGSAGLPVTLAEIDSNDVCSSASFATYPAKMDAATHVGPLLHANLAPSRASSTDQPEETRVPVGIKVYDAAAVTVSTSQTWAYARWDFNSSSLSFGICSGSSNTSIHNLLTKQLPSSTGGSLAMAPGAILAVPSSLYQVKWYTSAPNLVLANSQTLLMTKLEWLITGRSREASIESSPRLESQLALVQGFNEAAWGQVRAVRAQVTLSSTPENFQARSCLAARATHENMNAVHGMVRTLSLDAQDVDWRVVALQATANRGLPAVGSDSHHGLDSYGHRSDANSWMTPMLVRSTAAASWLHSATTAYTPGAETVMVTGGLNGVGLLSAKWTQERTPQVVLLLLGRRGRPSFPEEASSSGVSDSQGGGLIQATACHVGIREDTQIQALLSYWNVPLPAIGALIHSGGVLEDSPLPKQTSAAMRNVLAPKAGGARLLLERAAGTSDVHSFIVFSSIASFLGSFSQANYGATNALLDAWASMQRNAGLNTSSMQWGAWSGVGMAARLKTVLDNVQQAGLGVVSPSQGLKALGAMLHGYFTSIIPGPVLVSPIEAAKLRKQLGSTFHSTDGGGPAMFAAVLREPYDPSIEMSKTTKRHYHEAVTSQKQIEVPHASVEELVTATVRDLLELNVPRDAPLMDSGLDSLGAVDLRGKLSAQFSTDLPATAIFDYPSISMLTDFISLTYHPQTRRDFAPDTQQEVAVFGIEAVQATVSAIMTDLAGQELSADAPLMESGIDSLAAGELQTKISEQFGVDLPATAMFDYPSIYALATFIASSSSQSGIPTQRRSPLTQEWYSSSMPEQLIPQSGLNPVNFREIAGEVSGIVQQVLGIELSDADMPLMDAGLDSLGSTELRTKLETQYGLELSATVTFDFPSIAELSSHLIEKLTERDAPAVSAVPRASTLTQAALDFADRPRVTHVASIACRYPYGPRNGTVENSMLEQTVLRQTDVQSKVPLARWDAEEYFQPLSIASKSSYYVMLGGFVEGLEQFDSGVFQMSEEESRGIDPQARLLLELVHVAADSTAATAVSAGWATEMAKGTGVYVGCMYQEYLEMYQSGQFTPASILGNGLPYLVGRVSYLFGLQGPCISTDTACSSSLIAAHLAHTGLIADETVAGMAGGVNTMLLPSTTMAICSLQALSQVARCKSFDDSADGYGRGEAIVAMMLTTVGTHPASALLVCGSALNQDGRSSGLTAPNGPSQTRLVSTALAVAGFAPNQLRYVAVHGTGTPLGDPIEMGALGQASAGLSQQTDRALGLGSVKSCYGHTEGAAGLTGVLLAVMAVEFQVMAGVMHMRNINPHVAGTWDREWRKPGVAPSVVRQASTGALVIDRQNNSVVGTSSFGMSGVNAHCLLRASRATAYQQRRSRGVIHWLRSWHWPYPPVDRAWHSLSVSSTVIHMNASIKHVRFSQYSQYVVKYRSLLPPTAVVQVAFEANSLLQPTTTDPSQVMEDILLARAVYLFATAPMFQVDTDIRVGSLTVSQFGAQQSSFRRLMSATLMNGTRSSKPSTRHRYSPVQSLFSAATNFEAKALFGCVENRVNVSSAQMELFVQAASATGRDLPASQLAALGALYLSRTGSESGDSTGCDVSSSLSRESMSATMSCAGKVLSWMSNASMKIIKSTCASVETRAAGQPTMLYATQWQASTPDAPCFMDRYSSAQPPRSLVWILGESLPAQVIGTGSTYGQRMDMHLGILQGVQGVGAGQVALSLRADKTLASAKPGAGVGSSLPESVHAMVRTLATEVPHVGWKVGYSTTSSSTNGALGNEFGQYTGAAACMIPVLTQSAFTLPKFVASPRVKSQTVMVTGGLAGIGMLVAGWMTEGAPGLTCLLLGRSGRAFNFGANPWEAARGAFSSSYVEAVACDISVTADAGSLLHASRNMCRTIFHSGGISIYAMLPKQTTDGMRHLNGPKVNGTRLLTSRTGCLALDAGTLFSSISAVLGFGSQSTYSAANASLDWQVAGSAQMGLPISSMQWGAWAGTGMAASMDQVLQAQHEVGLGVIYPVHGLTALGSVVQSNTAFTYLSSPLAWPKLEENKAVLPGILQTFDGKGALTEEPDYETSELSVGGRANLSVDNLQVAAAPRQQLQIRPLQEILAEVREVVVGIVGNEELTIEASLLESGVDSLSSVEVRSELGVRFGLELPSTVIFDQPSISALAGAIQTMQSGDPVLPEAVTKGADEVASSLSLVAAQVISNKATHRVYCFHGTGAMVKSQFSSQLGAKMSQMLPPSIEVYDIMPPGRPPRADETSWGTLDEMANDVIASCGLDQKPYFLVGHSYGAMCVEYLAIRAVELGFPPTAVFLVNPTPVIALPLEQLPAYERMLGCAGNLHAVHARGSGAGPVAQGVYDLLTMDDAFGGTVERLQSVETGLREMYGTREVASRGAVVKFMQALAGQVVAIASSGDRELAKYMQFSQADDVRVTVDYFEIAAAKAKEGTSLLAQVPTVLLFGTKDMMVVMNEGAAEDELGEVPDDEVVRRFHAIWSKTCKEWGVPCDIVPIQGAVHTPVSQDFFLQIASRIIRHVFPPSSS
jgi:acyl transferase domain-containing protein/acyl carrier protein